VAGFGLTLPKAAASISTHAHTEAPPTSALTDVTRLSALELRVAFASRALSPVEAVGAVLDRIETVGRQLNAFVTVTAEEAIDAARRAERAWWRNEAGPLAGIPFSVKDTIVTKGVRTTMGSRRLADWVPSIDAPSVERCRRAGGALLGKTNTPEFGWKYETTNPLAGTTRNPWNLDLTPGGSSGGAAAVVAAGLGPLALGSDTAGSTRIPAAFCGVIGFKPSYGVIPVAPGSGIETLGHVGVLARAVRDVALMLDVCSGPDPRDRLSLPAGEETFSSAVDRGIDGLRIAWSSDLGYAAINPEVRDAVAAAVRAFDDVAVVEEISPSLEDPFEIVEPLLAAGAAGAHRDDFAAVRDELDPERVPVVERGFRLTAADVGAALAARARFVDSMRELMEPYDLLLTPAAPVTAFEVGKQGPATVDGRVLPGLSWGGLAYAFNLTGQPAASVPCGLVGGLPVGLQIVGPWRDDAAVLRACAAFERARPWAATRPDSIPATSD